MKFKYNGCEYDTDKPHLYFHVTVFGYEVQCRAGDIVEVEGKERVIAQRNEEINLLTLKSTPTRYYPPLVDTTGFYVLYTDSASLKVKRFSSSEQREQWVGKFTMAHLGHDDYAIDMCFEGKVSVPGIFEVTEGSDENSNFSAES